MVTAHSWSKEENFECKEEDEKEGGKYLETVCDCVLGLRKKQMFVQLGVGGEWRVGEWGMKAVIAFEKSLFLLLPQTSMMSLLLHRTLVARDVTFHSSSILPFYILICKGLVLILLGNLRNGNKDSTWGYVI